MLKKVSLFVGVITLVAGFFIGAPAAISFGVDRVVSEDAKHKAESWSENFIWLVPDLERMIAARRSSVEQSRLMETTIDSNEIFWFELFDLSGRTVATSDNLSEDAVHPNENIDLHALEIMGEGRQRISLKRGAVGFPDTYIEAYVPLKNRAGKTLGSLLVYVNQTNTTKLFYGIFSAIAFLTIFTFGVPCVAFVVKARQENMARKEAEYLAKYDQLAGMLNRSSIMKNIEKRLFDSDMAVQKFACILIDIDHFKLVNDKHGHKVADAFLRHVARSINKCLNEDDLVGRMAGDEFLVVANRSDLDELHAFVKKIRTLISVPLRTDGVTISGHVSIGVHFSADSTLSPEDRVQKAEVALYQAKLDGRDTCCIFTAELEEKILRQRAVETAILDGLMRDRFEVSYQPLVRQKTKRCAGFEALVRLRDAEGVAISPAEFIPIAEAMGHIKEIGALVLRKAIKTAKNWPDSVSVSVNLSVNQFEDGRLVPLVKEVLSELNFPASRLELEITESLLMENTESVAGQLEEIRNLGVSLAMDDFGTGYSSLGYLWQYGFDKIKIDRAFISGLNRKGGRVHDILATIILLGHRLDMSVTAEGIETEEQAALLEPLSCDYVQGYLYGKPMVAEDIAPYLLNNFSQNNVEEMYLPGKRKRSWHNRLAESG